jgi:hypothetical protein
MKTKVKRRRGGLARELQATKVVGAIPTIAHTAPPWARYQRRDLIRSSFVSRRIGVKHRGAGRKNCSSLNSLWMRMGAENSTAQSGWCYPNHRPCQRISHRPTGVEPLCFLRPRSSPLDPSARAAHLLLHLFHGVIVTINVAAVARSFRRGCSCHLHKFYTPRPRNLDGPSLHFIG